MNIDSKAEEILKKMPEGLSKIEQARFIYIELSKLVVFDENFRLGGVSEQNKIYKSSKKISELKDVIDGRIICVSLTNIYNRLLNEIGIEAAAHRNSDKSRHVYTIFEVDGTVFKADLQNDLKYLQSRRRTKHFGSAILEPEKSITKEELEAIDCKLGYKYEGEELINSIKEQMSKKCREGNISLTDKLKFVFKCVQDVPYIKSMGYVERRRFYEQIIIEILDKEAQGVHFADLKVIGEERKYTQCLSVEKGYKKYDRFIYSHKAEKFLPIDEEKLAELVPSRLKLVELTTIPDLKHRPLSIYLGREKE